jgi:bifunctional UDP-N-acetylglucosamine pyrophosphorylase/glucosamine-1-phosphate N-acetyltransferase
MSRDQIAAIVLAAGLGTRMKSAAPKVLHAVAGRPMLDFVLDEVARLKPARTVVVAGPDTAGVAERAGKHALAPKVAIQDKRLGTAHAVMAAEKALGKFDGTVLVLYGDSPLVRADTLKRLTRTITSKTAASVAFMGFRPDVADGYGRFVLDADGAPERIVEARDLTQDDNISDLCNGGVVAADGRKLFGLLKKVRPANNQKEYYLTDLVALARKQGLAVAVVEAGAEEPLGVNSRLDLATVEMEMQHRLRMAALDAGVTMLDPASVHLSWDTRFGRDVVIEPNVYFGPGVSVADNVTIKAFCHIEGAVIGAGAIVGPFARLRPGTELGEGVHIGNYVEVKNAKLAKDVKANHLSYLGDATVGAGTNVGAGTITCNYDGFDKHRTEIGANVFIGSDVALVAPVKVGDGALIGAGSVITKNVSPDALAITRAEQKEIKDWAKRNRAAHANKKR